MNSQNITKTIATTMLMLVACSFSYQYGLEEVSSVVITDEEYKQLLQESDKDALYRSLMTNQDYQELKRVNPTKAYTVIIYIAADNDLHPFAWKNIKQMEQIGSNENLNIIVQINTPGNQNPTKRYVIKNGKRLLVPADGVILTEKLDSGNPQTLIDCVAWAVHYYPADNVILNLWNHGSGIFDPFKIQKFNSADIFKFNPETKLLEIDRSINFTDTIEEYQQIASQDFTNYTPTNRGICFDETYKSYMSTQDLEFALSTIHNNILQGKKLSILWFDACLMAMLEIAHVCKDHVDYLVASQEVEYASGSNYDLVLRPLAQHKNMPVKDFAHHITDCFEKSYQYITKDYTQSAIDLSKIEALEANVNAIAEQILVALQDQKNSSVTRWLQQCKSAPFCISFEEPSYKDLLNLYNNLRANIIYITMNNKKQEGIVKYNLLRLLDQGVNLINSAVICNKVGANLKKAGGISIYFPEQGMFPSYPKSDFAKSNRWNALLVQYLLARKK